MVVLSTELTDDLIREGFANDLARLIQERRKQLQCEYTDRIEVGVVIDSAELRRAIEENAEYIQGETLADRLVFDALPGAEPVEHTIAESSIELYVAVLQ